jgi:hypothetical protein
MASARARATRLAMPAGLFFRPGNEARIFALDVGLLLEYGKHCSAKSDF